MERRQCGNKSWQYIVVFQKDAVTSSDGSTTLKKEGENTEKIKSQEKEEMEKRKRKYSWLLVNFSEKSSKSIQNLMQFF